MARAAADFHETSADRSRSALASANKIKKRSQQQLGSVCPYITSNLPPAQLHILTITLTRYYCTI